ncbi:hypothetical protein PQR62_05505 [Herbaspirillum lusitanum]|uniref:YbjN domain-containing protein n=1 Tax=Herbaspirillum lusitanum TaxID=213312 RepID=A0ABW9A769_9BURK
MTMNAHELAQRYVHALNAIGVIADIDEDNDVVFKMPGVGHFFIGLDADNDPEFMRLVYPNFVGDSDEARMLSLLNKVNGGKKAVKLWMFEREDGFNVSASIESFLAGVNQAPDAALLTSTLERCIASIQSGVAIFMKEMRGLGEVQPN